MWGGDGRVPAPHLLLALQSGPGGAGRAVWLRHERGSDSIQNMSQIFSALDLFPSQALIFLT